LWRPPEEEWLHLVFGSHFFSGLVTILPTTYISRRFVHPKADQRRLTRLPLGSGAASVGGYAFPVQWLAVNTWSLDNTER